MNKFLFSSKVTFLVFSAVIALLSSCQVNKYLDDDQKLIREQRIIFKSKEEKIPNKTEIRYSLQALAKPEPNGKFLWLIPYRLSAYYKTLKPKKYGWIKRWLKNSVAEEPALYDSSRIIANVRTMQYYLKRQGYMDAQVEARTKLKKKKAKISYTIDFNKLYKVSEFSFVCKDSLVLDILNRHRATSFLKPGSVVSQANYDKEVSRIGQLLRNNGYASFFPNYVDQLRGDSLGNYRLEVFLKDDSLSHEKYYIGDINVYLDKSNSKLDDTQQDTVDGIVYHYKKGKTPYLDPELISRKIDFRSQDLYRKDLIDHTQAQLGRLPVLRRVGIAAKTHPEAQKIDYDLTLQRNANYDLNTDIKLGYVTLASDRPNRIGITGTAGLSHNNLFGGGELFTSEVSGGLEFNLFQASFKQGIISQNIQFNNSLNIQSFKANMGLYKLLHKLGLNSDDFQNNLKKNAQTRLNLGIQFLNFEQFYSYQNFEIDLGHEFEYKNIHYQINQTGLLYWNPTTDVGFDTTNTSNPNLRRSFEPRMLTGLFFRNLALQYQSPFNAKGEQFTFLGQFESSGHEVFLANQVYRWATGSDTEFYLGRIGQEKLRFAHFMKLELDGRYFKRLGNFASISARADVGVALPYGFRENGANVVPYVNQFGVGGPYSLRGWETRELGPGGVPPPDNSAEIISFAQKGDLKLELNLEYRFKLFWYLRGAFFIDAGNVWLFKKLPLIDGQPPTPPEAIFSTDFINQMAVAGGYGIRFDYNFFVVRLDLGYKLRNPYINDLGNNWVIDKLQLGNMNFNFAVGYPF